MKELQSYLCGAWVSGDGEPQTVVNPSTGEGLATLRKVGSLAEAVDYARTVGGKNLRAMSLPERADMIKKLAKLLHEHREELLQLSVVSGGNTRGDAKFDVDGATGVLGAYAYLAKSLGEGPWISASEPVEVMRGSKIKAQDVLLPRHGVAIHINAFNFPAWGMVGKLAVALLAGMPVFSKPATSTVALAARIGELIVDSKLLPEGAFSLLVGSAGDLLDQVKSQDVIAFTGSADTGTRIRAHETVMASGARVNVEADSLNAVVIGPDVESGTELFDLVVRDCVTELTQKAGQKCTGTRRILVPQSCLEAVREALLERLGDIAGRTGNPETDGVRMGPLSTKSQLEDARTGVATLEADAKRILGDPARTDFGGAEGFFLEPVLLEATAEAAANPTSAFHHNEVFGPVATLLPYDGSVEAASAIIAAGHGSLVSTLYSDDRTFTAKAVAEMAPYLGRLVVASEKSAGASISPGCVFPVVVHGGPGRAGGGAELGGITGLELYMQRTTIQGGGSQLARML
ncbi:MAG: 3,4-dehydroadipyl-CoA semialdehyde dehydrogenase [Myxococcota bacterium]